MIRSLLLVVGFLSSAYMCASTGPPEPFEVRLAPGVTQMEELAFSVSYPGKSSPVMCRELEAYSGIFVDEPLREEWKARAPKALPCPNPLKWGQDLGEGWEVFIAAKPVEQNRSYRLRLSAEGGGKGAVDFCIFRNGDMVVDDNAASESTSRREEMVRCRNEDRQEAVVP